MYIYIYTYIYISIPVYAFLLTSLPLLRGSLQREVLQRALELVLVVRGGAFSYVSVRNSHPFSLSVVVLIAMFIYCRS